MSARHMRAKSDDPRSHSDSFRSGMETIVTPNDPATKLFPAIADANRFALMRAGQGTAGGPATFSFVDD